MKSNKEKRYKRQLIRLIALAILSTGISVALISYTWNDSNLYTDGNTESYTETQDVPLLTSANRQEANAGESQLVSSNQENTSNPTEKPEEYSLGYTTCKVNIRKAPSTNSTILDTYSFNNPVQYTEYDDTWYKVALGEGYAYVCKKYISSDPVEYKSYHLSSNGFKSFMGYKAITSTSSTQYKIQKEYATTGRHGIRVVNGRYCVALGSAVDADMGTYVDLVLENGTVIECVLADQKADKDTQSDNLTTAFNGCVSEFIVDTSSLKSDISIHGDVSYADESWDSPVVEIRVYQKSIFD